MIKTDEEFLDAGKKDGILIWRIENFKVKKVKDQDYGKFHTGDSYLILETGRKDFGEKVSNIFYWEGAESTLDETSTCAFKAHELECHLGGVPVQYREVQKHESTKFLALFEKTGLRYLSGGHPSGFKSSKDVVFEPKLYMVKGKSRIVQVQLNIESLNHSDVFILDNNETIYQWNPQDSSKMERFNGDVYAKQIRDDDHCGKGKIITIRSEELFDNEDFWALLPGDKDQIKKHSDLSDKDFDSGFKSLKDPEICLYRVTDEFDSRNPEFVLVGKGTLYPHNLDSKDCFIVDSGFNGVFCWIGSKCTKKEKEAASLNSLALMNKKKYPKFVPLATVSEGGETATFKALFKDWVDHNNNI